MDLTSFGIKNNANVIKEINDEKLNIDILRIKDDFKTDDYKFKFLPWFLKYQIKDFDQLIISPQISKILDFFKSDNKQKPLFLYGMPGCGKTTTLTLIANHFGFEIFEMNASDNRSKNTISQELGNVIKQKSLFDKPKLILIDEVDGIDGTKDRGGLAEIIKLIGVSNYKIVFTANDIESEKMKPLVKVCTLINLEKDTDIILRELAKKIFNAENILYDEKNVDEFIKNRNFSDIRGFINDLQTESINGKFTLSYNLQTRNYKNRIDELLNTIYYSYPENAIKTSFNSDVNLDDLFLFIEENTPRTYDPVSTHFAFDFLSKADVFRARILKWQYWRYLVYVNFYLTFAVSHAKSCGSVKHVQNFDRNARILKKWIYANKTASLKPRTKIEKNNEVEPKLVEKIANKYSHSVLKFFKDDLPFFIFTYKNNKDFREQINLRFEIDKKTQEALITNY